MQQQKQQYKVPYHFLHIQNLLVSLLQQPASKYENLLLTTRTAKIVYSIITETQIFSCGFKKIIHASKVNPYMEFQDVVMLCSLSGNQDFEEISQFSKKLDKVYVINLGISTPDSKQRLKNFQFKQQKSIKGYKQQNLDFYSYLHNIFVLNTKIQNKKKTKVKLPSSSQDTSIDRLCSYLCSFQHFSQFQFYLPKNRESLANLIKNILNAKLAVLSKYGYKGLDKNQGMSATKTRIIVLERSQQVSPFVLSLYYGPLAEELNVGKDCLFLSPHSIIYNTICHMDLMSASKCLQQYIKDLSENKEKQLNSVNLSQAKKVLQKAYNPNLSKQELSFHETLLGAIQAYMQKNCNLLVLQQSIANKINQNGEEMKGSKIVEDIYNWCNQKQNQGKYDRYLGLVVQAFMVHKFWWFQKNQLIAGISDQQDLEAVKRYCKNVQAHNLKEVQPKIQDGVEVREMCFRHSPNLINQLKKVENEIKQKNITSYDILKVSRDEMGALAKKTRVIVYINSPIGYNELSMLVKVNENSQTNYEFACQQLLTTKQWTHRILHSD